MKLNKAYLILASFIAVAFVGCKNDDPNDNSFTNKIYIDAAVKTSTILIKTDSPNQVKTITSSIAKPAAEQINIVYKADISKVDHFNMSYYNKAIALPAANYKFVDTGAIIPIGAVQSTIVSVEFVDIAKLDRTIVYVLPVTIESASNIDVLASARTIYYVFKGGAMINVVADVAENHLFIVWKDKSVLNGLTAITMEALVRIRAFDKISSVMGIEGKFLMRFGDNDRDQSQLQIASKAGNFPDPNPAKNTPKNEWVHVALTLDAVTGAYFIYVNGLEQSSGSKTPLGTVDLGADDFYIGKSWNDERWIDGEISECRIWGVVRTQEEIQKNIYGVSPGTDGLRAYWKFDEGSGSVVHDRTANGNDAKVGTDTPLKWTVVSLPK